jgi:hypothetical protein
MIITYELVKSLHQINLLCDVGLPYIINNGYIGTTRSEFINKIKAHIAIGGCPADYLTWSINTLVKSELIKRHCNFKPTGLFRVQGNSTIFENFDSAFVVLEELKNQNLETSYLFCVEEQIIDDTSLEDILIDWRIVK